MPRTSSATADTVALADTESLSAIRTNGYLEVECGDASEIHIHIDDGAGGQPSEYTLTAECYKTRFDDWMHDTEQTVQTSRSHTLDAKNRAMRFDVKNTSGTTGDSTYRINIEAIRSDG